MAVRFEGREWTYATLEERVSRLARVLREELGIAEGDRVAHLGLNSPDLLALVFACARVGAIVVPLSWRLTAAEHAWMIGNSEPAVILVEPEFIEHVEQIGEVGRAMRRVLSSPEPQVSAPGWLGLEQLVATATPLDPDPARDAKTPLLIVYTSGTTGHPKGTVLTQEAIFYCAVHAVEAFEMTARDHVLTVLPMFHVGGMNIQTLPAIRWGATVTIHRRFDPAAFLAEIAASRPTLVLAVPTISLATIAHPEFPRTDVSSLRCVGIGSTIVPETAIRPWLERGVQVTQVYGLTESSPTVITLPIADAARKVGSCGKPLAYAEARLVDDGGREVPPGASGEIWLRGRTLLREYWRNPEATREAVTDDGWLRTGDIAHRDEEGFYYVDARKKDVIISGGENIYPAELENVLAECDAIAEAAVVGRSDPRWGDVPVACVVLVPGASLRAEEVIELFRDRLARFKHPRDVVFLDEPLPRTSLGKVRKDELRARLAALGRTV